MLSKPIEEYSVPELQDHFKYDRDELIEFATFALLSYNALLPPMGELDDLTTDQQAIYAKLNCGVHDCVRTLYEASKTHEGRERLKSLRDQRKAGLSHFSSEKMGAGSDGR